MNPQENSLYPSVGIRLSTLIFLLVTQACSQPVAINVSHTPRFVHTQTDPLPTPRSNYPTAGFNAEVAARKGDCDAIGVPLAGMDMMMRYRKFSDSLEANERIFQRVSSHFVRGMTRADSTTCGDRPEGHNFTVLEYFDPADRVGYDVLTSYACAETTINHTLEGHVGVVDLEEFSDELRQAFPQVDAGENVSILAIKDNISGNIIGQADSLAGHNDLISEAEEEAKDEEISHWKIVYEFDGCSGPGERTTDCGPDALHCLKLEWDDAQGHSSLSYTR